MLKQAFSEFSVSEGEGLHKGYDSKLRSLEIDVKGGSSYGSRSTTVAPTHSAFIGAASTNTKMVYFNQPSYSSSISYTPAPSGSIMEDVLHSFVAKNEPTQQLAYEDFEQLGHFAKECKVKKVDEKAMYSAFKISEVKTEEPKAMSDFAVHAGNAASGVNPAAAEFAMIGISPKYDIVETAGSRNWLMFKDLVVRL
nr:hypothetical protein [Tanacetum cinerariifolium]